MDLDKFLSLIEHQGAWYAGTLAFAWVSWKLGNALLDTYKERLVAADVRDDKRVNSLDSLSKTMDKIAADNEKLNANQQKMADLLLNSCKFKS